MLSRLPQISVASSCQIPTHSATDLCPNLKSDDSPTRMPRMKMVPMPRLSPAKSLRTCVCTQCRNTGIAGRFQWTAMLAYIQIKPINTVYYSSAQTTNVTITSSVFLHNVQLLVPLHRPCCSIKNEASNKILLQGVASIRHASGDI